MISKELLFSTLNRAAGFLVYGGPGLDKTLAIRTLPPPILHLDFEGGAGSLSPWMNRMRRWDEPQWTTFNQTQRKIALELVAEERRLVRNSDGRYLVTQIDPAPYIDSIWFDVQDPASYSHLVNLIGNFDPREYNTLAIDPLYEFAVATQTRAKQVAGRLLYTADKNDVTPMELNWWGGAQERAGILLRQLRKLRDYGVFIYLTSSEQIEKEYVKDPRERKQGEPPQEPYNVKGSANVSGKLVNEVQHLVDIMMHARPLQGRAIWVTQPEPMTGGTACWEAKDRFGRIAQRYISPNFRAIMVQLYGKEGAIAIYNEGDSQHGTAAGCLGQVDLCRHIK